MPTIEQQKASVNGDKTSYASSKKVKDVTQIFGENVFSDKVMKARLSDQTYKAFKKFHDERQPLSKEVANEIAEEMKKWAMEKGATHYTHWFQPLTGGTAEKHDSFIDPVGDGTVVAEFSGKQLIKGEPDASSFPSGGLRATFEARGYTAWDTTSPAFIKEDAVGNATLCIPTAFYSYTGEALDKKTPLLRSMDAVSKQALRVLKALGNKTSKKVFATVGPEQEYFLVDKKFFEQRLDMMVAGRTLFGAPAPKGQELEDQYFGAIKDRVSAFMKDVDVELWKMGVTAKTKHNEVAPAQFEMAVVFQSANIAADHNQLVMETLQKVAIRHGLVCLLYEKPYAGVNGSGKHNNWSLSTDDGQNLLEPGDTPHDNEQFLVVLSALIKAVDKHADKLRAAAGNPGNDLRLGANEAPPAIISVFMGSELTAILENLANGKPTKSAGQVFMNVGVDSLPDLPKDNTDRNRTSPFAFTGNKFEFRMVPSSASISGPNVVLNTIVSEALDEIATRLEKAKDINKEAASIVKENIKKHGRVIFNGNNYSDEWVKEAKKRGLPNIKSSVEALKSMKTKEAYDLFDKYKVLSPSEMESRYEIYLERYAKCINIEALASIDMASQLYIPAALSYAGELADTVAKFKAAKSTSPVAKEYFDKVAKLVASAEKGLSALKSATAAAQKLSDVEKQAAAYRDKVIPAQLKLREAIDELETIVPKAKWPTPSYADMLFKL